MHYNYKSENIRKQFKLHDFFSEYNLTDGQSLLLDKLASFLNNKNESVFLLKGYAGTGKTFIIKGLTDYFNAVERHYVLAAPTGKASRVIAQKTKSPACTIHKSIYSFENLFLHKEGEEFKFNFHLASNDNPVNTVYIIDEVSMISDVYNEREFFKYGSGYLLRDFFEFVNLDYKEYRKKIIFIGDDAQLFPVKMNFSPALDQQYLFREYNIKSILFELREVVRQKSDSGVMLNSIKLRKSLKNGIFNQLSIDLNYPDIINVSYKDFLDEYLKSCNEKINAESIVIAYSNADVADYNREIRQYFFPNETEVVAGDKVMAVQNNSCYGFLISNGDFGSVKKILRKTEHKKIILRRKNSETNKVEEISVSLAFKDIIVGFKDNVTGKSKFFETKILENVLYSKHRDLNLEENKALYVDFCIRNPKLKPGSLAFQKTLRSDPYFNAMRLKFGYAITCHKAQGSEWNNVFVRCKTNHDQLSADYFRWLYTAMTRTSKTLYLLDPPNINIGNGIKPVNFRNTSNYKVNSQNILAENHQEKNDRMKVNDINEDNFGIPPNAYFSRELLRRILNLLKGSDVKIQDVSQHQYLEIYYFKLNNEIARIDLNYNAKGKITKITSPLTSDISHKLRNILSPISGMLISLERIEADFEFIFTEDFLNDFHSRFYPLVRNRDIKITKVESMDWKQRYTFNQSEEYAVIDIFYNGKNQFTKYAPVTNACSSDMLVDKIQTIIKEEIS